MSTYIQDPNSITGENQLADVIRSRVRDKLKAVKAGITSSFVQELLVSSHHLQQIRNEELVTSFDKRFNVESDEGCQFFTSTMDESPESVMQEHELAQLKDLPLEFHLTGLEEQPEGEIQITDGMSEEMAKFDFYLSEQLTERIPAEYENRKLQREQKMKNLFIPSTLPVALSSKLPINIAPRVLEEEGFYVSHKPDVLKKNINKMENRFLVQEERKYWFGEDGNMIALPDPIKLSWNCRLPSSDHVVEDPKPGLETVYRKAIVSKLANDITSHFREISEIYQLDINIANLRFVHHPLYSREHVLAEKLMQLYDNYQQRQEKNVSQLLIEKLQTLNNAIKNLERRLEIISINLSRIEDLKKQMRETKRLLNVEKEKDHTLLTNILKVWKQIKSLRKFQKCTCTPIRLQVQELEVNYIALGKQCEVEYIADVIELEQELEEEFRKEMETYNEKLQIWTNKQKTKGRRPIEEDESVSEYADFDPGKPPKLSALKDRATIEDLAKKRSAWIHRQQEEPILIPKLSLTADVTPTSKCSGGEMHRRMEVQDHKFFIRIFYNEKLVSSTVTSQLQSDFSVQFRQIFNIQIIHKPENIRLEIYELISKNTNLLAKVYIPIPEVTMITNTAVLEEIEFSSDEIVTTNHEGVGSTENVSDLQPVQEVEPSLPEDAPSLDLTLSRISTGFAQSLETLLSSMDRVVSSINITVEPTMMERLMTAQTTSMTAETAAMKAHMAAILAVGATVEGVFQGATSLLHSVLQESGPDSMGEVPVVLSQNDSVPAPPPDIPPVPLLVPFSQLAQTAAEHITERFVELVMGQRLCKLKAQSMLQASPCSTAMRRKKKRTEHEHYCRNARLNNTSFFLDEDKSEECLLLTSGKLLYAVSWGVGKNGIALAPPAPKPKTYKQSEDAIASIGMVWLNDLQKLAEWAKKARIDPNDPQNSDLMQIIKYATDEGQYVPEYFRLEQMQEEFNFVTDKKLERSKRFRLLMLRNSGVPEYCCYKLVPPYDREIPDNIFQEFESQKDDIFIIMGEDSLTEQRMMALKYLEKAMIPAELLVDAVVTTASSAVPTGKSGNYLLFAPLPNLSANDHMPCMLQSVSSSRSAAKPVVLKGTAEGCHPKGPSCEEQQSVDLPDNNSSEELIPSEGAPSQDTCLLDTSTDICISLGPVTELVGFLPGGHNSQQPPLKGAPRYEKVEDVGLPQYEHIMAVPKESDADLHEPFHCVGSITKTAYFHLPLQGSAVEVLMVTVPTPGLDSTASALTAALKTLGSNLQQFVLPGFTMLDSVFVTTIKQGFSNLIAAQQSPLTHGHMHAINKVSQQQAWMIHLKVKATVMKRLLRVKHHYTLSDIVVESEEVNTISQITLALINLVARRKALKPLRKERKKIPAQTLSDGDIKLLINVIGAYNIPMRKCIARTQPLYGLLSPVSGMSSGMHYRKPEGEEDPFNQIQVQPFVEVTFQQLMYQTSIADGSQPCWNEKLEMDFKSPNGDYNSAALCKLKDKIFINVFDNIAVATPENDCLETCNIKPHVKHWLGSIAIPFSTILEQSKVSGTFRIDTPPMLLGYTWKKIETGSCEQFYEFGLAESSLLTIFITLDPQVSCSDNEDKQPPLWQLETIEDEEILHLAYTFQKEVNNLYPKRRIVVSIIDSECRVGIVTRYIRPLCPPQELLDTFPENPEATFNLIARFVSLIPYLPDSLGFSDACNIWLTSQQFLNLILGGKEDHAVLLCNYFLYMKLNAFVLLGTSILDGVTAYVITQEKMNTMIWSPETGECYEQFNAFCPLQSADCLINNENIWFNIQKNSLPMSVNFDITKEHNWRPFFKSSQHYVLTTVQPQELIYYYTERSMVDKLRNRIEWALKNKIMEWRAQRPTRWNRYCTGVFQNFLPLLEQNLGRSVSEEQSTGLESLLKEFKVSGFPIQMRYSNLQTIFDKVYSTGIHNIEIPNAEFAVAVYIHPYPTNVLSVWIYVASLVHDI
ncbi:protein CC2D2B-like [Heptranchias perlo]|uniref:protein CC2D2B-like n=1 Tax=Heptranchias perlo TaxID=212740 RepID=UPI00355A87EE